MSKAFLRESETLDEHQAKPLVSPLPPGARNYLTAAGATKLREELRRLRLDERPALAARAAHYGEAKARLELLDQRITYLQQSLIAADIVPATPGPTDVVRFGTTVVVRDAGGRQTTYRLVGVDETDPAQGAISWISPLAQALMNTRSGDRVHVVTPGGAQELTIVAIRYD